MNLSYTSDNTELDGKKENDSDNSVSYKVNISGLKICGATYFQITDWDDEKNYVDFRNSVIKEKGYDACEIDVKDLEISLKMEAK